MGESARPKRRFQLVLIKPSHYDDDGYVIQWVRAFVPSNTLKYAWHFVIKSSRALRLLLWLHVTSRRLQRDPNRYAYTDLAMSPVTNDETEKLELLTHSEAARQAVAHAHKIHELTGAHGTPRADAHA